MSVVFELEPVTSWDVEHNIVCMACDEPFTVGGSYVSRAVDEWQEYRSEPVFEAVCVSCAYLGVAT